MVTITDSQCLLRSSSDLISASDDSATPFQYHEGKRTEGTCSDCFVDGDHIQVQSVTMTALVNLISVAVTVRNGLKIRQFSDKGY